jgi:ubiquinone/menaquinone biosynthesis C-methylase UbiE
VSFVEGRLPELPFADCSFDAVLCIGVLAYLANPEKALMEIRRILRRDGLVVLQASNALCLTARLHSTLRRWYRRLGEALGGPAYPHLRIPLRALRPGTLHRLLEDARFRIESHALYDFRPPLLQWVAPSAALATAQRLQRLQHSHMLAWLGEGIVLRARAC